MLKSEMYSLFALRDCYLREHRNETLDSFRRTST